MGNIMVPEVIRKMPLGATPHTAYEHMMFENKKIEILLFEHIIKYVNTISK
jgi:hypothetical protein